VNLSQFLRIVGSHKILVGICALLGVVAAGGYAFLQSPVYSAKVELFVSISDSTTDSVQLNQGGNFAQQRVKSYAEIVNSPTVTAAVISKLKLSDTPTELAGRIKASSPLNTVLIDITVTDGSASRARDIANAVADEFPILIDKVETPSGKGASPVKISTIRAADLPTVPISPRPKLDIGLGLVLGLALGIGGALLREGLDHTIRGKAAVIDIADAPVIGSIPEAVGRMGQLISEEAGSAVGEAFRQLRTNIRFLSIDRKLSSFVVTGSLPNEGKTTVASNLAIALAHSGERVVLVDGDLRRSGLADQFGLPTGVGLTSVLLGDISVGQAIHQWREDLPLYIMTTGPTPPNPSELLGSVRLFEIVDALQASGATVIFDSPPLLPVTDAAVIARATGGAIMVVRYGSTRNEQLAAAVDALRTAGANILGVVGNRVKRQRKASYGGYYVEQPSGKRARHVQPTSPAVPSQRTPVTEHHR
jgi:polysaccharide biosynthesis transport protein